ncbi:MAG: PAS domain S-box protein [Ferruginibacter sp.]
MYKRNHDEIDNAVEDIHNPPMAILIIEDNLGDVVLLKETISETSLNIGSIEHTQTLDQAIHCLKEKTPDIIFLDLSLPDSSGLESFNQLQQYSGETPIIILTGIKDTGIALEAINKGAQDFLLKSDLDENLLAKTILYSIERKRISESLRRSNERYNLVEKATNDMVWDWDMVNNKIFRSTAGWNRIIGPVDNEEYNYPDAIWNRMHPDDKETNNKDIARLLADPATTRFEVEFKVHRTNNTYANIVDRGYIIRDENGVAVRLIGASQDITEQKTAEIELRRLSLIAKETVNAIIITNETGIVQWTNESFENITGYKAKEIAGKLLYDFLKLVHASAILVRYARMNLKAKRSFGCDIKMRKKNAEVCWLRLQCQVQQNSRLEVTGFFAIATDISKEKIAEEKLVLSEQRFRSIIESSSEGITLINKNGDVIETSPAAKKMLGYSSEDYVSLENKNLIHPEDKERVALAYDEIIANENHVKQLEYRFKKLDGNYIWIESTFHNLLHEPAIEAVVIHFRDISSRKSFEEILKSSEEKYRKFFNSNPSAIVIWNPQSFEIIEVNEAAIHQYGYRKNEFLSLSFIDLLTTGQVGYFKALSQNMLLNENFKAKAIVTHKIKSGEILYMDIAYQVIDYYGKKASLAIANNITDKINLEKKLAEERQKKQQQITAAVITAQEQEREELGRELHDNINQILATTKLYVEYAITNDDMKETLLNSAKDFIISAVSELRRLSQTLSPPSLGEVGIEMALKELVENLQVINKFKFHTDWQELDKTRLSEQFRLTIFRIVQEQLNNIIKHADAKNVWIIIKLKNKRLAITIKDDGKGFKLNDRSRGVGLKNIGSRAELHNGTMQIKTAPGKGCELNVLFNL